MDTDALFAAYAADKTNVKIRNIIVERNLPLVRYFLRPLHLDGAMLEECMSIAQIYLIKAVNRFNPSKGYRFVTYASRYIEGGIKNAMKRHYGNGKVCTGEQIWKLRKFRSDAYKRGAKPPTVEEEEKALGVTAACIDAYEKSVGLSPFEERTDTGDWYEVVGEIADPSEEAANRELVETGLRHLPEKWAGVIRAIYFDGKTHAEIAADYGVTPSRVGQILHKALERMRRCLEERSVTAECFYGNRSSERRTQTI